MVCINLVKVNFTFNTDVPSWITRFFEAHKVHKVHKAQLHFGYHPKAQLTLNSKSKIERLKLSARFDRKISRTAQKQNTI
jgi:hypothetical protein